LRETTFLQLLVHTLRTLDQAAVALSDRGFRRTSWLQHLQELRQLVVVRLVLGVLGYRSGRGGRPLRHWQLAFGQTVALGAILRRQDRAVQVRVVGGWTPEQRERWWLATALLDLLIDIVAWYDRRLTVEEQCRHTKVCSFGVRLEWTPCCTPAYLARFTLLVEEPGTAVSNLLLSPGGPVNIGQQVNGE
jgi:hypothetical protein